MCSYQNMRSGPHKFLSDSLYSSSGKKIGNIKNLTMKTISVNILCMLFIVIGNLRVQAQEYALVIHGGAGVISRENMSRETEAAYRTKINEALLVGDSLLKNGVGCTDVVVRVIRIMEDSPLFNAGKGAVFTNKGTNELDASIMDGETLKGHASLPGSRGSEWSPTGIFLQGAGTNRLNN